jgi:ankyrin repeat protein
MTDQGPLIAAFFEAVRNGNEIAIDAAIGAHPELLHARDETSLSPVLAAAYAGHSKLATRLSVVVAGTPDGLDFFDAAAVGNVGVVRSLLTADRASVDDRGPDGYTGLHLAAYFGQLEVARMLLGRGADPNAVTLNGARVTPLHSAVTAKHRDTASLLLALGASPNAVQRGGFTALHIAARDGDEAIVDMLLLRGADATRAGDDGKTSIDLAVENGHAALAGLLRSHAAKR